MDVLARRRGIELVQPVDGCEPLLDKTCVILREVPDRHFMTPSRGAGIDAGGRGFHPGRVGQQRLQHCRLAETVSPDEDDLLAAVDDGAEAREDLQVAERLAHALRFERDAARRPVHRELDVRALDVRSRELGGLQPLDFLLARHHLARARASREARDEVLELRDFLLALLVVRLDARADLRLGQDHVVVPAGIRDDRLVVDVRGVGADRIHEMTVVRDDDERALVADEELAQPVDRVEVQVVGRLVEEERLRPAEERLRQKDAHFLSALQLGHRAAVQPVRDVEALEQNRGVALRLVAVLFADNAFELAEAHAFRVGHVGLRVEPFTFFESRPQAVVAHDDGVGHTKAIEGEMVLPQHAEPGGVHDRAALRRQLAGQQLHEGGFAGAVRARQPVPTARRKRRRHIVEEHLRPEPHRHTLD